MIQMHPIYEGLPNKQIACIDMRSFYASCAAVFAGLDVMRDSIAVVGNLEQKGSIVSFGDAVNQVSC